jgi:hypothetical protein
MPSSGGRQSHPRLEQAYVDQLEMVRPNKPLVALPAVPAAYSLRLLRDGEESHYEDWRTPAISIYLRLGWQPYIYKDEMRSRWDRISAGINQAL